MLIAGLYTWPDGRPSPTWYEPDWASMMWQVGESCRAVPPRRRPGHGMKGAWSCCADTMAESALTGHAGLSPMAAAVGVAAMAKRTWTRWWWRQCARGEAVMTVRTPSAAPSGPPRMSCRHRLLFWTSPRVWPSPPPPHVPYCHHLPPPPHASLPPPPSPCASHRCRLNGRRGKRQRKEIRRGDSRGKREGNRDGDGLGC